jgi:formylglycine-generating enzyme required for sulfatase activity
MIAPEEIVNLAEYLKEKEFQASPHQLFAARQVLLSEAAQDIGAGSLVRLSTLLGPIFCRTPEEQQQFEELYLQWVRQRSGRPNTITFPEEYKEKKSKVTTTIHWRMKVLGVALLILPILTAWFLWQDLRLRQVIGQVMTDGNPASQAMVRLGEQTATTETNGEFQFPFQAKDMPMDLAVEMKGYLPSSTQIGQSIKTNRNWFYLRSLDWSDQLNIGEILLSKEKQLSVAPEPPVTKATDETPKLEPPEPPVTKSDQLPSAKLSLEQIATLKSPTPPWWNRLDYYILGKVLAPVLLALGWLLYRHSRRGRLQRQSSRIPPKLKHVQVQAGTQHIFPSLSLRHMTQRLRQTRFVESTELDVHRTIQCTLEQGGLFTPVYGSKHEPGYVALIDRATMADHQAHLAAQLVKDLARGYVLVRQYEFDEQPIMLRSVDPLRPSSKHGAGGTAVVTAAEVVALEEVQAKFPARRLLCFADPITCFDPLTGKLHPWVEILEAWEERFLLTTTPDGHWGQAERILSRRGFQVIPLSLLGLRLFSTMLEQGSVSGAQQQSPIPGTTNFHDRMPERWLERHPPSQEFIQRLLSDLEQAFSQENEGVNAERGRQGLLWLAGCAAYPEIHWALTLEWGVRLFGHTATAEILLPKITRLVWFRHAFMPDWFREALYDRLAGPEADRISQELSEILSAVNPENRDGLQLHIATQPGKKSEPASPIGSIRAWFRRLGRKLKLQAMGQAAEPGSPMGDYVMLQYLSGKQGKALTPYAPKALLRFLFPMGQPWLGFRPVFLMVAAVLASGGFWWSWDPIPVPLPSAIQAVALSQDGTRLAVGREDGRLQVWDWKTKQMVVDIPGEHAPITSVALSADGKVGATGYHDGSIHLWDGTTGAETVLINTHSEPIVSLAFNHGGDRLVSGDVEGKMVLTGTQSGKSQVVSLIDSRDLKSALAFSPDGLVLAMGKKGGSISLLPNIAKTTEPIRELTSQAGELLSLFWDPTGTFLMSYSEDGTVRIWHQETGQLVSQEEIGPSEIGSLSWSTGPEAWLALLGSEGPDVWSIQIPEKLLKPPSSQKISEKTTPIEEVSDSSKLPIIDVPMVLIPSGKFTMGQDAGREDQRPAHQVYLESFWIDKVEVTVAQYAKFLEATKLNPPKFWNSRVIERRAKYPVVGVDWTDAKTFCEWAGKRLPSEAEWEKAARGMDERFYPWGNDPPTPERANFKKDLSGSVYGENLTPVGSFESGKSPFGVYDMSGNVWEWVSDWYDEQYYAKSPKENPFGPSKGVQKGLRGGGWADSIFFLNSVRRYKDLPKHRSASVGFRCARDGERVLSQKNPIPNATSGKDGAPMVLVPAGEFTMGALDDDKAAEKDERPAHQVYLDAFYIDQFEVTTSRYANFFQETKRKPPQYWSETVLKEHGNKPVVGVSWEDANAYCVWAGKRLPTEAEWEKAARGTIQLLYPWGNDPPSPKLANFDRCCNFKGYGVLTDVGSFEQGKSPYGVYDMAGNVWEWVTDWYNSETYQRGGKAMGELIKNPRGPEKGEGRVLRGGSWKNFARDIRSSDRTRNRLNDRYDIFGFRCARSANDLTSFLKETASSSQKEPLKIPDNEPVKPEKENSAVNSAENAQYLVAVYSYKVNGENDSKVRKYFKDQGYTLRTGWRLSARPIWLASESTVFYYDKKSQEKAAFIANALKEEVHSTFVVKRGAGFGVIEGKEKWTFYVHYLGESQPVDIHQSVPPEQRALQEPASTGSQSSRISKARLNINFIVTPRRALAGKYAEYRIMLKNFSEALVKNITVLFPVPKGLQFNEDADVTPKGQGCEGICSEGEAVNWSIPSLGVGESQTIIIKALVLNLVPSGSSIQAKIHVEANELEPVVLVNEFRVIRNSSESIGQLSSAKESIPLEERVGETPQIQQSPKELTQQAPQQAVQAVENFPSRTNGKDGAPMVLVPAGEFMMGAKERDKAARLHERPTHIVFLDDFYLDQFEVTTSLYNYFLMKTRRPPPRYWTQAVPTEHAKKPVVGVSWEDSKAYCNYFDKRLPTEAEWEKAAGGTKKFFIYPWGDEPPNPSYANFGRGFDFKNYEVLSVVGSKEIGKTVYGNYDMAGNVWEWVGDWYDSSYYQNSPRINPLGPQNGTEKVLRGGSWSSSLDGRDLRITNRNSFSPFEQSFSFGFRCAQDAR